MALTFGDHITDISDEEDALAEFLALTREREADEAKQGRGQPGEGLQAIRRLAASAADSFMTDEGNDESVDYLVDPDPGYERQSLADTLIPDGIGDPSPKGPGEKLRKDIKAKTAMLLTMTAGPWAARDPHCGGALLEASPDIADALTDIFCDSPDIVRWFTASGKYMKWLTLFGTLQPVLAAVGRHHILKKDPEKEEEESDWSAYGVRD